MKKYTLSLLLLAICCCWGFSQAEFCGRAVTLECGQSVSGNNATGTDLLRYADYGTCMQGVNASSNPFTGREIVYIVNVEGTFTISLSGLTNDLDLFVFPDFAFSECRGLSCTRRSTNSNRTNESITISNASGTYFIVVDAYSASIASPFRLSLDCSGGGGGNENPCEEAEPITCDETIRSNNFSGSSQFDRSDYSACHTTSSPFNGRDRVYRLAVPSNRNEVRVQLSGLSADLDLFIFEGNCAPGSCVKKSTRPNNSSEILVLQNTASKTYYLVVDAPNDSQSSNFSLNVTCEDPCEDIETDIEDCESVSFQYAGSNGSLRYQFSVPSALASGRWTAKKGNSTITIGNGRSINFTFNSGGEYEVCYIYTNADGCEIKCCKTIFIENPYDCDRIFYRFNNTTNRYELSIPGIAAANVLSWTDDDNNTTIGTGTTVTVPIGAACTVRRFSVRFLDPATNCYRICCIAIYICDPYDCNKINATENTSNYTLNLPGVAAANVLRWQNDDTGVTVTGSASQSSITVPKPAPGQCARYSAFFFDPGVNAYRVCCIRFCQPDECEPNKDPNCDDITFRYIGSNGSLRYQFSVPNGLPSSTWTAQRTGGGAFGIGSGRTVNFTFSASGEYEICYKYTNSEGCEVLCCITIFIEDPYDCDRITYSYDRNTQLYTLTIPGIPAGNIIQWQDDQTGQVVGTGTSITVPINSTCELRLFSVIFLDPATNCYRICCLRIFICDPYDCDDITVTENATDYTLSIPGIPAANILRWQDDQTLATIA
ncbi:MAG: PPC domain-containing protein, partial [Bacteroidota bacterium]